MRKHRDRSMNRLRQGFTLLELLVVLALIALLVGTALPFYRSLVQQGHRMQARSSLLQAAQRMQHHFAQNGNYRLPLSQALPADAPLSYAWSLHLAEDGQRFILQAQPQHGNADDPCGVLLLDHRLIKGAGGVLNNRSALTRQCWHP